MSEYVTVEHGDFDEDDGRHTMGNEAAAIQGPEGRSRRSDMGTEVLVIMQWRVRGSRQQRNRWNKGSWKD
jgi:hypothetical protein